MEKLIERFNELREGKDADINVITNLIDEKLLTPKNISNFIIECQDDFSFNYYRNEWHILTWKGHDYDGITVIYEFNENELNYYTTSISEYLTDGGDYYADEQALHTALRHCVSLNIWQEMCNGGWFEELAQELVA